ncbi:hypothetical protein [Microbispora sp. H10670]|uniref:hypothetical protein n=1 Tax=Microbispora sp. H10670 TaxID=2729108 RepID=UPI001C722EAC|nr:hypothetical protein [Microbispora sp. H10670]
MAKTYLGRRAALVAGASLIVDYVLNVAVSVAAGVAALTSAFPELLPFTVCCVSACSPSSPRSTCAASRTARGRSSLPRWCTSVLSCW